MNIGSSSSLGIATPSGFVVTFDTIGNKGKTTHDANREECIRCIEEIVWHVIPRSGAPLGASRTASCFAASVAW